MLKIENLRKVYGEAVAVDTLSLTAAPGEIYGLLGPNGAGKTTTISILCGLIRADGGSVFINGMDLRRHLREIRAILGVVPQEIALYEELSAEENLRFWGRLYGITGRNLTAKIDTVLDRVGLKDRAREPIVRYSGGMKRRINLAAALLHDPKLLLLDEPTVGIDPQARLHILDIVREVAAGGATVLYTTHHMDEAEKLCHRVGIMDKGRLMAEGTMEQLIGMIGDGRVVTLRGRFTAEQMDQVLKGFPDMNLISLEPERCLLLSRSTEHFSDLIRVILDTGIPLEDISVKDPSLESLFIKLTGKDLRD